MPASDLKPHQQRVLDKLEASEKGLLVYHGLGSGKTLTALSALKREGGGSVIGPASLKENFSKENKKHQTKVDVNYSTYAKPRPTDGNLLVYDEAHRMGQQGSNASMYHRVFNARKNLLLTGTPIRNNPAELAPLLNAVGADVPANPKDFNEKYIQKVNVRPGFWGRLKGIKDGVEYSPKNLSEFRSKIKGRVDYHGSAKDEYPTSVERTINVTMSPSQMEAYKAVLKGNPSLAYKVKHDLPASASEAGRMNAFLNATRQVSNTPGKYHSNNESNKVNRIVQDIHKGVTSDPNYKGVTYSNYLDSGINPIAKKLREKGIPYGVFNGKIKDSVRAQTVKDYNDNKIKHLLISGAGAEGLDLKGTKLMQIMEPH